MGRLCSTSDIWGRSWSLETFGEPAWAHASFTVYSGWRWAVKFWDVCEDFMAVGPCLRLGRWGIELVWYRRV